MFQATPRTLLAAAEQKPAADTLVLLDGSHLALPLHLGATRVIRVPFNDLEALAAVVDLRCAAVLIEPVQLSAGVVPATLEYLQGAQRLCREQGAVLILDETGSGMGRCGALLAEELYGVRAGVLPMKRATCYRPAQPKRCCKAPHAAPDYSRSPANHRQNSKHNSSQQPSPWSYSQN